MSGGITPLTTVFFREAAARNPDRRSLSAPLAAAPALQRRLRILRHRALRWFGEPIAVVERERRHRDLDPSVWRYDLRPRPEVRDAWLECATKRVA